MELVLPPPGQILPRRIRLVHNGRWHLIRVGRHEMLGWGDLALADLHRLRPGLGGALFLALEEEVGGSSAHPWEQPGAVRDVIDDPMALRTSTLYAVSAEAGVLGCDNYGVFTRGQLVRLRGLDEGIRFVPGADIDALIQAAYTPAPRPR